MDQSLELFFSRPGVWKEEFLALRQIILTNTPLIEDFKWKHPCYTLKGKNVVLIHGFKDYCALLFHKGALMHDPAGILIQQTENVQSARQIRFANLNDIFRLEEHLITYLHQAVDIEKSGARVQLKSAAEYPMPEEFEKAIQENADLAKAFYSLTPGRQKGYLFYFNQAKQSKTREARIEKYYQKILDGKGLDD